MLGLFGKRTLDVVVLFFAAYAFAFVPLGKHTGFEHLRAILGTRAAKDAGSEALEAANRLRRRLWQSGSEQEAPSVPHLPHLPHPPQGATPRAPELPRRVTPAPQLIATPALDGPDASL